MGQFRDYLDRTSNNAFLSLNESPVAVIDDWKGFEVKTERIGKNGIDKNGIDKNWEYIVELDDEQHHKINLYKCKGTEEYVLGVWGTETDEYKSKKVLVVIT